MTKGTPSAAPGAVPGAAPAAAQAAASSDPSSTPPLANPLHDGPPPWTHRTRELHDAADRLLGGELGRAEQRCDEQHAPDREACVDAALAEHEKKLAENMAASFRMIELLQTYGESKCRAARSKDKKECSLAAMEGLLVELGPACPQADAQEQHLCLAGQVLKRLGP